jgi:hypothetical protein
MILTTETVTVKVNLRERSRIGEAAHGARLLAGTAGGTFSDMDRDGRLAGEVALMRVLAERHGFTAIRVAADPYGAMPASRGDRTPRVPPSALCRREPREFVRGSDTDDLVPCDGHIDLYA